MNSEIKNAIKLLAQKVSSSQKADDAMKFAQAALNLGHTFLMMNNCKNGEGSR